MTTPDKQWCYLCAEWVEIASWVAHAFQKHAFVDVQIDERPTRWVPTGFEWRCPWCGMGHTQNRLTHPYPHHVYCQHCLRNVYVGLPWDPIPEELLPPHDPVPPWTPTVKERPPPTEASEDPGFSP